ncbi:riboflavin synthase [Natronobiforma cellulositropha]|uniref:riboflavin synthase n=1 Tax=Natronobiforma cellulositropha TaxID=1679076 RepID=UPI0021D5CE2B|nr:riboflavin synthase [Natronobiforma cellulositropha]
MYTGIVETTGTIAETTRVGAGRRLRIEPRPAGIGPDDSVAVSGVCLTAETVGEDWFETFLSAETLARTTLGDATPGERVNLERPLAASGRFHGHVVGGTVETTTRLLERHPLGAEGSGGTALTFALPETCAPYVVEKGPVAVDGVSLSIAGVEPGSFEVVVVPQTAALTTFSSVAVGDECNLEVDLFAKYAARQRALVG